MSEKTVSFSASELKAVLDAAIAEALAAREAKPIPANKLVDGKTEGQLKTDVAVCKAFKKAGFGQVVPRVDCMTYNRWAAAGYKVRPGERATKIKQFRLFHKTQVEFVGEQSKAEMQAEANAAKAATPAKPATVVQSIAAKLKGKSNPSQPSLV